MRSLRLGPVRMNTYRKDIEAYRNRAEHFRAAAKGVWDESSRASLLSLAADYDDRARKLEERMYSEQMHGEEQDMAPATPKDGSAR